MVKLLLLVLVILVLNVLVLVMVLVQVVKPPAAVESRNIESCVIPVVDMTSHKSHAMTLTVVRSFLLAIAIAIHRHYHLQLPGTRRGDALEALEMEMAVLACLCVNI